jgi:hypothetical protein
MSLLGYVIRPVQFHFPALAAVKETKQSRIRIMTELNSVYHWKDKSHDYTPSPSRESFTHANLTLPYVHNNDLQLGYAPVQIDDKVGTVPTRFLVCLTVPK